MEKEMNKAAVLHIQKSQYAFAYDEQTLRIRLRCAAGDLQRAEIIYAVKYDWLTRRSRRRMKKLRSDGLFDYYEISLHVPDSRIGYLFYLTDGTESYYYSEEGLTKSYDFSKGYYNFFQYPYINDADLHRRVRWCENAVFYQIFVDRFCRGDRNKDASYIDRQWNEPPAQKGFYGGDLKGIIQKLGYLRKLGVNALYLSPVFLSPSNHKYDTVDYGRVDPMFGDKQTLRSLVAEAHRRKMRVVLDAVFNHCSMLCAQFQDVMAKGKESPFYDWFIIRGEKPDPGRVNYECFAACNYMPKWNTNNEEVQDFLVNAALGWMRDTGIDGWRLDVADEVSHAFWRKFRREVKRENPQAVLIGESWHDAFAWLQGDQFDGIMNYSFTKACQDYFAFSKMSAQQFCNRLNELLMRNTDQVNEMMLNLLDSHDTERFLTNAGGDVRRLKNALAVMFFYTGMPCIYYGTEIGTEGGYDPDSRRTFDWDKARRETDLSQTVRSLSSLKRKKLRGPLGIAAQGDLLIMQRGGVTLVVNNTSEALTYHADGTESRVAAQSFRILERRNRQ